MSTETEERCFELGTDLLFHQSTEDPVIMTSRDHNSIMFMQRLLSYQRDRHIHHSRECSFGMGLSRAEAASLLLKFLVALHNNLHYQLRHLCNTVLENAAMIFGMGKPSK